MINLLFCGNSYVFDGVMTTLLSIQKTCKEPITAYILTMEVSHLNPQYTPIPEGQVKFLERVMQETNSECKAVRIDVTDLYKKELGGSPNENCYCSPYTLLRLLADIIPGMPEDKLLYLDVDLMFNKDIHLIYDIDLQGYEYAAAKDHYGKWLIRPNYINAGVLLFNMQEIKQTNLLTKARQLINTKKMLFADQSAIYNCTTKNKLLPQYFNDQKYLTPKTVIRHFCQTQKWLPIPRNVNVKPWDVTNMHKIHKCYQFDDVLYKYLFYKHLYEREMELNYGKEVK